MISSHIFTFTKSIKALSLSHAVRCLLGGTLLLSLSLLPSSSYAMDDIDSARRALRQIYYQLNQYQPTTTLYCGCKINYKIISKDKRTQIQATQHPSSSPNTVGAKDSPPLKLARNDRVRWSFDRNSCGYEPRADRLERPNRIERPDRPERPNLTNRTNRLNRPRQDRAHRLEVAHIMPASEFGQHLACWKAGGCKQCREDKTFNHMEGDLHNLYPTIGAIKRDRLNFPFADWQGTPDQYGKCPMLIDLQNKKAQPPQDARGQIARAYLYMAETYSIPLVAEQRQLYEAWHNQYPATALECERNQLIAQKQGNENHFITDSCQLNQITPKATSQGTSVTTANPKTQDTSTTP